MPMFPENSHPHTHFEVYMVILVLDFAPKRTMYKPVPKTQDSTFLNNFITICSIVMNVISELCGDI